MRFIHERTRSYWIGMRAKKKFAFICSATDAALKVVKCKNLYSARVPDFLDVQVQPLPPAATSTA